MYGWLKWSLASCCGEITIVQLFNYPIPILKHFLYCLQLNDLLVHKNAPFSVLLPWSCIFVNLHRRKRVLPSFSFVHHLRSCLHCVMYFQVQWCDVDMLLHFRISFVSFKIVKWVFGTPPSQHHWKKFVALHKWNKIHKKTCVCVFDSFHFFI